MSASIVAFVVFALAAAGAGWSASRYGTLLALRRRCDRAHAEIVTHFRQRLDLVPRICERVEARNEAERSALAAVIRARAGVPAALSDAARFEAEAALGTCLARLRASAAGQLEIPMSGRPASPWARLADLETRIAASRLALNAAVADYNATIAHQPTAGLASLLGFLPRTPYDTDLAARGTLRHLELATV